LLRPMHIDRRDGFPRRLFDAEVVCTTDPTAVHLDADHQQIVLQPAISLLSGTDVGRAFERLPGVFRLDEGFDARIFRRLRDPTAEELEALSARLRSRYPDRPDIYDPAAAR